MKIVFPGSFRCPGLESAIRLLWLSLLRVEKHISKFDILDQNGLWLVKPRILSVVKSDQRNSFRLWKSSSRRVQWYTFHHKRIICQWERQELLICSTFKKARRVPPAETRLTVYRRPPVTCMIKIGEFSTGAGGKPSTWFPPEGLFEPSWMLNKSVILVVLIGISSVCVEKYITRRVLMSSFRFWKNFVDLTSPHIEFLILLIVKHFWSKMLTLGR